MTFEEIREMVNATITENGQRQITGKYLEEPLTPEHQAVNAATYAKCKANVAEDKTLPAIVMDITQLLAAQGLPTDGVKAGVSPPQVIFVDPSSPSASEMGMAGLVCVSSDAHVTVNEDGSLTMLE